METLCLPNSSRFTINVVSRQTFTFSSTGHDVRVTPPGCFSSVSLCLLTPLHSTDLHETFYICKHIDQSGWAPTASTPKISERSSRDYSLKKGTITHEERCLSVVCQELQRRRIMNLHCLLRL